MPHGFAFRAATPDDAEAIAAAVGRGFEGYRAFAPDGWEPPEFEREVELVAATLGNPRAWCAIAERDGAMAGQARARRFYEREGWRQTGEPFEIADGLPTLEYRRPLRPADR